MSKCSLLEYQIKCDDSDDFESYRVIEDREHKINVLKCADVFHRYFNTFLPVNHDISSHAYITEDGTMYYVDDHEIPDIKLSVWNEDEHILDLIIETSTIFICHESYDYNRNIASIAEKFSSIDRHADFKQATEVLDECLIKYERNELELGATHFIPVSKLIVQ